MGKVERMLVTKFPRQLPEPTPAVEPRIKVEMIASDEGQPTAHVQLLIADVAEFNASIGAESDAFSNGVLNSISLAARCGDTVDEKQANFALSIVRGLHPRDQVEALLGAQMAAIHLATMQSAAKLGRAKKPQLADQHERALNRLARTYTAQVEALKRYRSKGEQRVYVERVTVNEGGQAIVGPVTHTGGVGVMKKSNVNLMHLAKRCSARSKRSGTQCKAPAVRGENVCRMHGAGGGAPEGQRNGNYRHGARTKEMVASLVAGRLLARLCRQAINDFWPRRQ